MIKIILLFVVLVFLIDGIVSFLTWQSRIHIGRWQHEPLWNKKVAKKTLSWLYNTPVISVSDNKRLILLDIIKGKYSNQVIQSWQKASLLLGLYDYAKTDASFKKILAQYVANQFDSSGNWKKNPKEIDEALFAFAILKNQKNIVSIKPAMDAIYNLIQKNTGTDGTIYYRVHHKNYRYVDTLGFICPFLVLYGQLYDNDTAIKLGFKQLNSYNSTALNNVEIPFHAYNTENNNTVGLAGWGRGVAWYIIALLDTYLVVENKQDKIALKARMFDLADELLNYQKENGSWSWQIFMKDMQSDSSATAVFSWFLSELNKISNTINYDISTAKEHLKTVTRRDGTIDFSQGDTKGIGVYSQIFDKMPFTQGFTLRFISNLRANLDE